MDHQKTIVFFSMESEGHINSVLSTMRELRRRGHKPVIMLMCTFNKVPKLREEGFQVEIVDESSVESEKKLAEMMSDLERFRKGPKQTFASLQPLIVNMYNQFNSCYDLIKTKLDYLKPDLVIIDHLLVCPYLLLAGIPWARFFSIFPSPLYAKYNQSLVAGIGLKVSEMSSEWREFTEQELTLLSEVRKFFIEKGAPDWESNEWIVEPISPHLNLYLGPKELGFESAPGFKPFPDTFFRLEHTIEDSSVVQDFEVPESLVKLPGKLIYFSLGTIASANPEILNKVINCLAKSPNKFIVSMGLMHDKVKLYPNMWGAKYVNQKAILPKVDLFITHGGHNSTIEAFHYGVPRMIVMPVFGDQFDCAVRLEECGFGRLINPFDFEEQQLLDTIETLLADEKMAERMKPISERLRSVKYYEIAADKIEELINKAS